MVEIKKPDANRSGNDDFTKAIVPYTPPWKDREIISAAQFGSRSLRAIRLICRVMSNSARRITGRLIDDGKKQEESMELNPPLTVINKIRAAVNIRAANTMIAARDLGRAIRVVGRVNLQETPKLYDDEDMDIRQKKDIVADLDRRIALRAPLIEEFETIGRDCFDAGMPPERLIAFLESEDVLHLLINGILNLEHSCYSGDNLPGMISSILDTMIHKLNSVIVARKKRKVDAELDRDLRKKITFLGKSYDPHDKYFTIARFINELAVKYAEYDILGWLKKNKRLLVAVLGGSKNGECSHLNDIINEVYLDRGQLYPEKYIELNLDHFYSEYSQLDSDNDSFDINSESEGLNNIPPFVLKKAGLLFAEKKDQTVCILKLKDLKKFFDKRLQKIKGPNLNLLQLRGKLAEVIANKISRISILPVTLVLEHENGINEVPDDKNIESLVEASTEAVIKTCQVVSSHVDVRNLLYDPMGIPPEIRRNYTEWFGEDGEFDNMKYRRHLRTIFGHKQKTRKGKAIREEFSKVLNRAEDIFQNVNEYLCSVSKDLDIPSITVPTIIATNDYAQLVKIACTTTDPRERFAARRKIELAVLFYTCTTAQRYYDREFEGNSVKEALEHSNQGIKIIRPENDKIFFLDNPDGKPVEISPDSPGYDMRHEDGSALKTVELIPAKFAGINCYLVPTSATDPQEYMGHKTLFNMLTNLLNEDNKRAKDMTDILRMTFVVRKPEELIAIQKELETNRISFGRSQKYENRYEELVDSTSSGTIENQAKSDEYRTLRYVVDVTIPVKSGEENGYAATVEIRVLLMGDLLKEKSTHNHASHKQYERRRLKMVLENKLAPDKIFSELYRDIEPDPDDVFQRKHRTLKDSEDFKDDQVQIPGYQRYSYPFI